MATGLRATDLRRRPSFRIGGAAGGRSQPAYAGQLIYHTRRRRYDALPAAGLYPLRNRPFQIAPAGLAGRLKRNAKTSPSPLRKSRGQCSVASRRMNSSSKGTANE